MFDVVSLGAKINTNGSVTGGFQILRDGKLFTEYSVTYHSLTISQVQELRNHADPFLKAEKLTGLNYGQMHALQKRFAQHMFKLGDKNKKAK